MHRILLALVFVFATVAGARADDAILVFDASGSMWGQIDGKAKIEIAREVIGKLLTEIPAERRLGLVAYGHRRAGDCKDIEEVVPVGTDRDAIRTHINAIKPKGKTPLTDGVRFAATKLRYTDNPATVILVSDGAESCNADPCALGRELEAAGAAFTVHVIGFGLANASSAAGLKCLAEATGGKYFAANNAGELAAALSATVAKPVPAPAVTPTTHVTLRATELDGGPEITSGLEWSVAAANATPAFTAKDAGVVETDILPGSYEVSVKRAADGVVGKSALTLSAGGERTVTIPLELDLRASIVATPASTAMAGSRISLAWTGPNRGGDFLTVVPKGAVPTAFGDYKSASTGSPIALNLPVDPGELELRYVLGQPPRVLATVAYTATPATATIEVPAQVTAGASFPLKWTGPNNAGDWLSIVAPDVAASMYASWVTAEHGSPATLQAPLAAGNYEVRYVAGGTNILARVPVTVTVATAGVEAPASVVAGAQFQITWHGPNNSGDWLSIVAPDAAASDYGSYVDAGHGSPAALQAPLVAGNYEVRYVAGGTNILARVPVTVTEATAEIEAPDSVVTGANFQISWRGPNNQGDWLTIVAPGEAETSYHSYVDADHGNPASLTAPAEAGSYELRYVLKGLKVIARRPITVAAQ